MKRFMLLKFCKCCRRIVGVADPQKMTVLLEFITDTDSLVECCRDEWLRIYDKEVGRLFQHGDC